MRAIVLSMLGCGATAVMVAACGGANTSDLNGTGDGGSDASSGNDGGGTGDGATGDGAAMDAPIVACTGGLKSCNGVCVDTSSDPNNCGGCNAACTGGSCAAGVCNLISADAGAPPPVADFACIGIDAQSVYVATGLGVGNGGAIYKIPISGGVPKILVMNQANPHGIASDGTNLFWANNSSGEIMKSDTNGMGATPIVTGQSGPLYVVIDAGNVYWNSAGSGEVWKASKTGANPTRLASGLSLNHVGFLAVDATNIYFTDLLAGFIGAAPIAGGGVTTKLAQNQTRPFGVGVDTLNVYWTNQTGNTVMKLLKTGTGTPAAIAMNQSTPSGLATDGVSVYWANSVMAGGIGKVSVGGTGLTPIAQNQKFPNCVAVDGTSVYWINEGGGTISKTGK